MYFFEHNEEYRGRIMLIKDDGSRFTYEDVGMIQEKWLTGIPARSLIFIVCRNTEVPVAAYLGCLDRGIVPLLLPDSITAEQLDSLRDKYHPSYMLAPADTDAGSVSEAGAQSLSREASLLIQDAGYHLISTGEPGPALHEDLALLLTTSGSTGSAKLVRLSKDNLQSNAESIAESLSITSDDRPITSLPMEYTYGLSVINSHVLRGAAVMITTAGILSADFWRFFNDAGATSFAGVPYTYSLLERLRFRRMDLPTLKVMTQAGGKLPPELQKTFGEWAAERGIRFYVMYGQTEATARMACMPYEMCLKKPGSIGIAIPRGHFSVLVQENAQAEGVPAEQEVTLMNAQAGTDFAGLRESTVPGAAGELVYRGPNVSLGYAQSADDLALGDTRGGVLYTGDLARIDEDGYFYITGRKSRFVKIMGKRVNLDDLEKLLGASFASHTFLCAGNDELIRILDVYDPVPEGDSAAAQEDSIQTCLREKAGLPLSTFRIHFAAEVPRTPSGKISYEHV